MKVKTSELTGVALDWAVAQATGANARIHTFKGNGAVQVVFDIDEPHLLATYSPTNSWNQCGPLVDKFNVWLSGNGVVFHASCEPHMNDSIKDGPSQKVAICRAVVTAKLGDEIELPAELFRQEPEKP